MLLFFLFSKKSKNGMGKYGKKNRNNKELI